MPTASPSGSPGAAFPNPCGRAAVLSVARHRYSAATHASPHQSCLPRPPHCRSPIASRPGTGRRRCPARLLPTRLPLSQVWNWVPQVWPFHQVTARISVLRILIPNPPSDQFRVCRMAAGNSSKSLLSAASIRNGPTHQTPWPAPKAESASIDLPFVHEVPNSLRKPGST